MQATLRKYKDSDKKQAIKLIAEVLLEIFKKKLKNKADLESIKESYKVFYIAEYNGKIIGTIALKKEADNTAKIKRFYVKKSYRKKGIGQKLMNKLVRFAVKNSYKKLVLSTYPEMKEAIEFYRKYGFKEYKYKNNKQIFFKKEIKTKKCN